MKIRPNRERRKIKKIKNEAKRRATNQKNTVTLRRKMTLIKRKPKEKKMKQLVTDKH